MGNPYLSVVIPAYNESRNIKRGVLGEVHEYLKHKKFSWEVLIVDDGSSDSTIELVRDFIKKYKGFSVMAEPHRGKGGTVIAGMAKASGDIVLFTDMDQATPISEFDKFNVLFESGSDIVIGSRTGRSGAPMVRKIMAFGFSVLRLFILGLSFRDTQCGFKAFRREASLEIVKRMKIFTKNSTASGASVSAGFDLEILYIARKLGYKISEVGVSWIHQESRNVNPIRDSLQGLRDLLVVRMNALKGAYGV